MKYIDYSVSDRTGYITLNRPDKRNALNHDVVAELKQAFAQAERDRAVKVVVLKANGESFCAGADLAYLQQLQNFSLEENRADSNHLKELFEKIYTLNKVVVAQVQGNAIAGGCGLASVCDFVIASQNAKFGYTEVKIGFIPAIVMVFLLRKIGEGAAKHLLLSGELISADEAQRIGMVYKVVPAAEIDREVSTLTQQLINTNSLQAMTTTKKMIADVQSMSLSDALQYAINMNAEARGSDDCKRGIAAFLNKEKIIW
jgi:methylglutaconyl-CoA hydratase